jgi:DMSO/TMAO reductase YedYZ molybdopterin-dependent catalytic subunit
VNSTARRGLLAGAAAGLALMGGMELGAGLGLTTLIDALQQPILATVPGAVFGFLIDRLQHWGKVIEEISQLIGMLVALALLGWAAASASARGLQHAGWAAAVPIWVVACLVLFPLAGQGLLGLHEGPGTPVEWLLLAGLYGAILDRNLTASVHDPGRRAALTSLSRWAAVVGIAAIGVTRVPGWVQILAAPPEDEAGRTLEITPVQHFYVVSKNFQDPTVNAASWSLEVNGMVHAPYQLRYGQLKKLPSVSEYVTMECISNPLGGNLMSTGKFTGTPLRELVMRARPKTEAGAVGFHSVDDYTESISLDQVMASPEILIVWMLDGQPLPEQHGYPARVLVPGYYGMRSPKWLNRITLTAASQGGYWEDEGWDASRPIEITSRIDVPGDGAVLPPGQTVEISGVALAGGGKGIASVEVSTDNGETWKEATLEPTLSHLTWRLWSLDWRPEKQNSYTLVVRARDMTGQLQTEQAAGTFPKGSTGWQRIQISVEH